MNLGTPGARPLASTCGNAESVPELAWGPSARTQALRPAPSSDHDAADDKGNAENAKRALQPRPTRCSEVGQAETDHARKNQDESDIQDAAPG